MYRLSGTVVLALALVCSSAFAQDADSGSILDRSPSENVASAASRGPASWVARARARHNQLIASRVTANPQSADLAANPSSGGSGSTGNSGGTSDGGLLDGLAGLLGGGDLGLSDLLSLAGSFGIDTSNLGGLTGGLLAAQPTPAGNLDTTNGGVINQDDIAAAGAEDALAQLLALQEGLSGGDSRSQVRDDGDTDELNSFGFPKNDLRAQQQTGDEPKFVVRLVDSWMNTVFTALTIGMQTPQFIDMLADGLRSAFGLPDPDAASGDGTSAGDGGSGTGTAGSGGSDTPGDTGGSAIDTLGDGSIV